MIINLSPRPQLGFLVGGHSSLFLVAFLNVKRSRPCIKSVPTHMWKLSRKVEFISGFFLNFWWVKWTSSRFNSSEIATGATSGLLLLIRTLTSTFATNPFTDGSLWIFVWFSLFPALVDGKLPDSFWKNRGRRGRRRIRGTLVSSMATIDVTKVRSRFGLESLPAFIVGT